MIYKPGQLVQSIVSKNFYLVLEEMTSFSYDEVSHFLKLLLIKPELNDGTVKPFVVQIKPFMRPGLLTYKFVKPQPKTEENHPLLTTELWYCDPLTVSKYVNEAYLESTTETLPNS